ncbi:MAG: hypothetical protein O6918_04205 [Deltaproteobacteria bacterium]|nr:hypothetical protein [Deltaproteobacteria bacterium]
MPLLKKLKEALDQAKISDEVYNHPQAFTAQEIAATQHISGREMAKVVIFKVNSSFVMVVLPSNRMVSFNRRRLD